LSFPFHRSSPFSSPVIKDTCYHSWCFACCQLLPLLLCYTHNYCF